MKPENINFLIPTPLSERDYRRFGARLLESRGFNVSYFDLTDILNPDYVKSVTINRFECKNTRVFTSLAELEQTLKNCDREKTIYIDLLIGRKETYPVFKLLTKYGLPYASLHTNAVPFPRTSLKRKVYNAVTQAMTKFKYRKIRIPDYILAGGRAFLEALPRPGKDTVTVLGHTLDYDLYLEFKANRPEPLVKGSYAVFLDEYLPYHPDFLVAGAYKNPFNDPSLYYDEVNLMLSELEKLLKIPVVIAAHPRARYDKVGNRFNGRKIIQSNTINLVANAEIVVTHASTSLNFAVLFNKPVIFMLPEILKSKVFYGFIRNFAENLGKTPVDAASIKNIDINVQRAVNTSKYSEYKDKYIKTSGSPEKYFWDIVADNISKE
ncbi:MAG: hypothetical protein ABII64_10815 [Elusimicrobiota bacterium]